MQSKEYDSDIDIDSAWENFLEVGKIDKKNVEISIQFLMQFWNAFFNPKCSKIVKKTSQNSIPE